MAPTDSLPPHPVVGGEAQELYIRLVQSGSQPAENDRAAAQQLLNLGLLREVADGYVPVDPGYVGARWTADFHAAAAEMLTHAADVSDALRDVRTAYENRTSDAGLIEYLRGSGAINARLSQVLGSSTEELLFCQPGGVRRREVLDETSARDMAALQRGVTMRTLYHEQARAGENMHQWVQLVTAAGATVRTLAEPFQRMFVIDRKIAVIPGNAVLTTSQEAVAYMVHDPGVAGFLADQFMRDWERAEPWSGAPARGDLTGRQETILRLLAAGETHQAIARQLGLGKRTMAEAVAELKQHFGVATLFEMACAWKDSCA